MKKKPLLSTLMVICSITSVYASSRGDTSLRLYHDHPILESVIPVTTYTFDLDPFIVISQNVNEKGAVVMSGQLVKPVTDSDILISVKYQNAQGEWITAWCKTLYSSNQYNENLNATFELPASLQSPYNLKVQLSSDSNNFSNVTWNKTVTHYKFGDYSTGNCELDENEYTILFTPKKSGTVLYNTDGSVSGVRDRVKSQHLYKKLDDIVLSVNANGTLDNTNANGPVINIENPNNLGTIVSSQKYIYQGSDTSPFEFSYHDPVYVFAGKFSSSGFFINFSNWFLPPEEGGEPWGRGYLDFTNPNALVNRYYNLYNYINEKLTDIIADQEPVVIVVSKITGFRVYKSTGQYITVNALSNYNTVNDFGYPPLYQKQRGPGSENFSLSNTSKASLYGIGAIRNRKVLADWNGPMRPLPEVEAEIKKFIKYVGVFGNSTAYDSTDCSNGCVAINAGAQPDDTVKDWTKAPNSYIFTGKDKNGNTVDGLYIPVKKAYEMWKNGSYMKGQDLPAGTITADVLWEDNMGLIKSKENYTLDIIGSDANAEIKVPVNKVKEGNAVIAYKVNGVIFWSWHVWVTDDPTNGSTYKSYDDVKRELSNGTVETIPNSEWGWMDRNLGALGSSLNGDGWNRSGGLVYQWGRKDPFPSLTNNDASFYQITGSMGKIVYEDAAGRLKYTNSPFNDYKNFNDLRLFTNKSTANITDNIRTSVKNPLSLLYVNDDNTTTPSVYGTTADGIPYYYNWFGQVPGLQTSELSKVNLWSDNSKGIPTPTSDITIPQPYRNKSSYDPCPNGWRLPSVLVASSTKNVRMDFTPFGPKVNSPLSALNGVQSNIPPGLNNLKPYLAGIKVYPQYGFDMTNVGGNNIGIFPGTGWIGRGKSGDGRYHTKATFTDQLETYLWTATMTSYSGYSSIASALRLTPSSDQIVNGYQPDAANYPNVYGLYSYKPADDYPTNNAHACRCIKDPLFTKNNYDFETKYFTETETYTVGLDNPNSYMITKSTADQVISIPVSKAFSVQSNYLGNTQILNAASFTDLKANVLWTDNNGLITQLTIDNPSSKDANINVKVNANKAGNAIVTLHNGSISNPVYWSWHIWVTNTPASSLTYANDTPITTDNYMNYTQQGTIMKTTILDRNLGAIDAMPTSYAQSAAEVTQLNNSQGLHYQWGRKDPLPTFTNIAPNNTKFNVFLGTTTNGTVTYSALTEATYNSSNVVNYNTYKSSINATDKIDVRIEKLLGYSVANPLKFMMPTVTYPTRPDVTYVLGSDWLFDTNYHGLYAERWGLGSKKSVFDPCPGGWRIPETGTSPIKSSPWSLKNNPEFFTSGGSDGKAVDGTEAGYYGSVITHYPAGVTSPYGRTVGFRFDNSLYNVGGYPKGYMRGKRSVMYTGALNSTIDAASAGGIWYANLHQNLTGRATFMSFDRFNRILVKYTDADPYAAMNCRCVKQEDNGAPRGPLPGIPVTQNTGVQAKQAFSKAVIEEKVKDDKLVLYPNPVKDILHIDAKDDKEYYYQIYNMSGQLVKEGKFTDKQTDISSLLIGTYLIRINNSETIVKINKQ
ncbi:T9SS type A sorting domain-containing protein [Chryseobacterium soli]|uniref:T9SS type A sorting domain-containing protein n=1 Tax=Chryseobacterium soli TaxID=445961 RepID=UPI0029553BB7|nr:T9SS type A sorting domain-containing protein [Chryseobacterium soli]MDV7698165.1 T9SS type A sorting domain-containing protein [Chryseobacterium soli]